MITNTELRKNTIYVSLYVVWSKIIFIEIIPYFAIVIMNIFIITKITKSTRFRKKFQRQYPDQETTAATNTETNMTFIGRRTGRTPSQGDSTLKQGETNVQIPAKGKHDHRNHIVTPHSETEFHPKQADMVNSTSCESQPFIPNTESTIEIELSPLSEQNGEGNVKIIEESESTAEGTMATKSSDEGTASSSTNFIVKVDESVPVPLELPLHSEASNHAKDNVKEASICNHLKAPSTSSNKYLRRNSEDVRRVSQPQVNRKSFLNKGRNATKKGTQVHKRTFLRKQQEEHSLGIILILMSILFIICQSLKIVPDMYEIIVCRSAETYEKNSSQSCEFPDIIVKLTNISHLLLCINSSANFLIL